jgi:hypothetical protein
MRSVSGVKHLQDRWSGLLHFQQSLGVLGSCLMVAVFTVPEGAAGWGCGVWEVFAVKRPMGFGAR